MKKFTLEYVGEGWSAMFDVDVAKAAPLCRAVLEEYFDPNFHEPEDETDLAAVRAYLEAIAPELIEMSIHDRLLSLKDPKNMPEFMLAMDGSTGITITHCDEFEFDRSAFDLTVE